MSWIQYFYKWLSTASTQPIRIAEISLLVLTLAGFAIKQKNPKWVAKMDKLVWQIPLGLLVSVFCISIAVSSYNLYQTQTARIKDLEVKLEYARKQAYPPITTLMMESYFKNKDISLGEFAIISHRLTDKTFENCRIHGAAVIFLKKDIIITKCKFKGDVASKFITTTNKKVSGVLIVERCTFIGCDFDNISFIGSAKKIEKLKAKFF